MMNDYIFFFALLGAIFGALVVIACTLRRILNILIMKNKGEPSGMDLAGLSFEKMAMKKK